MKKIWNLMLVALVMLGAAACTEKDANVDANEKAGFSFYAEVADATRATIEKEGEVWNTVWDLEDKLYVTDGETSYVFACTDVATGKFTCYDDAVKSLVGQPVTITTDGKHHSLQGKKALYTTATVESFGPDAKIKLEALTSFFRYTYYGEGEVKLTLSAAAFRNEAGEAVNEVVISGNGEQFVAFWPTGEEVTLTYAIDGVTAKQTKKAFAAGMVYNLGTLVDEVVMTTVYLAPGVWLSDNPNFSVYYWIGDYANEVIMTKDQTKNGVFKADIHAFAEGLIFKRLNPADNTQWNKTANLTLPADNKDHYYVTGWNDVDGEWREYVQKVWAFAGNFNNWADIEMTRMSASISYVSGVALTAYSDKFKVKELGSWDLNYGAGFGYMVPGNYMSVSANGGDITVTETGTYDIYFNEVDTLIYVVSTGVDYMTATEQTANGPAPVTGNFYYFKPNSNWINASAKFVGYFWNGSGNTWAEFADTDGDGIYECNLGDWTPTKVIYLRKDPAGYVYNNWDCWDRIGNITIPSGKNFYTMADGVWSQQIESGSGYTGGTWATK